MVSITSRDNKMFILNSDHIEKIESIPETIVTLTNGKKYIITETAEELLEKIKVYKNSVYNHINGMEEKK